MKKVILAKIAEHMPFSFNEVCAVFERTKSYDKTIRTLMVATQNSNHRKCPKCDGDTYISVSCLRCDYSESLD